MQKKLGTAIDVVWCLTMGFYAPWLAGHLMGKNDSYGSAVIVVLCFYWAFVAWWRIFRWLRPLTRQSS